ncbi:MAG: hypothetical protein EA416_04745, partial [Trueperaceae bacterium]
MAALAALLVVGAASARSFDDPDYATLTSEPLHDLPMPEPGRFWLEFEGEAHEGWLSVCGIDQAPTERMQLHRFVAEGTWLNDSGQARAFFFHRLVSGDEEGWINTGHEIDVVTLFTRTDDDVDRASWAETDAHTPQARAQAVRLEPLAEVLFEHGSGDAPLVRVRADHEAATALAVIDVYPSRHYDDDTVHVTGPIAIAVRCDA